MRESLIYFWRRSEEHGYKFLTLTALLATKNHAGKVMESWLGQDSQEYYVKRAAKIKANSGQLFYYTDCSLDAQVEIRWQWYVCQGDENSEHNRWTSPQASLPFRSAKLFNRLVRAADRVEPIPEPIPAIMQEVLDKLRAVPVKYDTDVNDYLPDPDGKLDSVISEEPAGGKEAA